MNGNEVESEEIMNCCIGKEKSGDAYDDKRSFYYVYIADISHTQTNWSNGL